MDPAIILRLDSGIDCRSFLLAALRTGGVTGFQEASTAPCPLAPICPSNPTPPPELDALRNPYVDHAPDTAVSCTCSSTAIKASSAGSSAPAAPEQARGGGVDRRGFLGSAAAAVSAGLAVAAGVPGMAGATVNFETERYGDKELKIATVNKLRQQLRNAVRFLALGSGVKRGRGGRFGGRNETERHGSLVRTGLSPTCCAPSDPDSATASAAEAPYVEG